MKSSLNRLWMSMLGAGALALSGCPAAPPSLEEVRTEIPDRTVALLLAANASANKTAGGEAANLLLPTGDGSDTADAALIADNESAERALERLRVYLRDRVFTPGHFEGTDGDMAVFLLTDDVCTESTLPKDLGCVAFLREVDVRLGVTRESSDALGVTFMLGADRASPVRYIAGKTSLALQLALSELHQTAGALGLRGLALGAVLPDVLEGRVQVRLEKLGEEAFEASVSVLEAVRVEDTLREGGILFTTEVAHPLARLKVDGDQRAVEIAADARRTLVELPYRALVENGQAGDTLSFDLAGLSFTVAGADGEPLTVTGAGLGDATSSVKLDGAPLVSVDVNADAGRTFSMVVNLLEGDVTELAVTPGFELLVQTALEPLTVDLEIEPLFLDNSLRLLLGEDGGEAPRLRVHPADIVGERPVYMSLQPGVFVMALGSGEQFKAGTGDCFAFVEPSSEPEPGVAYLPIDFVTCN